MPLRLLLVVLLVAALSAVQNAPAHAQTGTVVPFLVCVTDNGDGTFTATFGYVNTSGATVNVPIGSNNLFSPGNPNRGQPTTFLPGTVSSAFTTTFVDSDTLVWTVFGSSASASAASPRCPTTGLGPTVTCVSEVSSTERVAFFGYVNAGSPTTIVVGPSNSVAPGADDQGQPVDFLAGTWPYAFSASYDPTSVSAVTWTLNGLAATADSNTAPCAAELTNTLDCVTDNGDGTRTATLGYVNTGSTSVIVPFGLNNFFAPMPAIRGQPTTFQVGIVRDAFDLTFTEDSLTWTLSGDEVTINSSSRACPGEYRANDDTATTSDGAPVTISVLDNDDLPPGDPSIVTLTQPANGAAVLNPDNTITYTPSAGFPAPGTTQDDTFTYTLANALGLIRATAAVTVTVSASPDDTDDGGEDPGDEDDGGGEPVDNDDGVQPQGVEEDGSGHTAGPESAVFVCDNLDALTDGAMTAAGGMGSVERDGTVGNAYCRVIVREGFVLTHLAEIGSLPLIEREVVQAVDVFGLLPDGTPATQFRHGVQLCLRGAGPLFFLSATDAARTIALLDSRFDGAYTCATVGAAGTVVLTRE